MRRPSRELSELLSSADTSAFNGLLLSSFLCPHGGCKKRVFPFFNRREEPPPPGNGGGSGLEVNLGLSVAGYYVGMVSGISGSGGGNSSRSTGHMDQKTSSSASLMAPDRALSSLSAAGARSGRPVVHPHHPQRFTDRMSQQQGDGLGFFVKGLQSTSASNLMAPNDLPNSFHHAGNNGSGIAHGSNGIGNGNGNGNGNGSGSHFEFPALPMNGHNQKLSTRPPRPSRPNRLQPMGAVIRHHGHADLAPQVLTSHLNAKQKEKPPKRLPSLSGRPPSIDSFSDSLAESTPHVPVPSPKVLIRSDTSESATTHNSLRSPKGEKRIQLNNRNSSNARKVGDVLVKRILSGHADYVERDDDMDLDRQNGELNPGLSINCVAFGKKKIGIRLIANGSYDSEGGDAEGEGGFEYKNGGGDGGDDDGDGNNGLKGPSPQPKLGRLRKGLIMSNATEKVATDHDSLFINGAS